MAALEGTQAVADLAALAGLKVDRQGKVFEIQAVGYMIEDLDVQRLVSVVSDHQVNVAPATQCQAPGHLPLHVRRRQALEAHRVEDRQGQQGQLQAPIDRHERRWHYDAQRL